MKHFSLFTKTHLEVVSSKYYVWYKVCIDFKISCVWVFHLHVFCASHVYSVLRGQKRMLDPLGLELQMAVRHHIVAGN